jgi:hypothetical protein
MPSKSRRLPGGKVRRPPARTRSVSAPPEAAEVAGPEAPPDSTPSRVTGSAATRQVASTRAEAPDGTALEQGQPPAPAREGGESGEAEEAPWMRLAASRGVQTPPGSRPASVAAPATVAAGAVAVGAAGVATAPRRRGAVTARSAAGRQARRTGPTSLDQAESSLTYVRTDLVRILILAAVMVGIIVVLAFVLR